MCIRDRDYPDSGDGIAVSGFLGRHFLFSKGMEKKSTKNGILTMPFFCTILIPYPGGV